MSSKNDKQVDLTKIIIKEIKTKEATNEFWKKYHEFREKCFKELFPNDNLPGRDVAEKDIAIGWSSYHTINWVAFEDSSKEKILATSIYGYAKEDSPSYEVNKHNSYFYLIVDSSFRRQGLGTHLFRLIVEKVQENGCKFIETDTYYESGMNFCIKYGGKLINESAENRLQVEDIDWDLVNSWIEDGKHRAPDVTLESFHITPEKDIVEICKLETEVEAQMPTFDNDGEKWTDVYTPERKREREKRHKDLGQEFYTIITQETDGTISGYTEIRYSHVERIERVAQGLTGVKKEYRGRGLGKWIKAELLIFIKNNLPKTEYIVTGNADHNAPMMSINNRLGFKTYYKEWSYKFTINDLLKRIGANSLL